MGAVAGRGRRARAATGLADLLRGSRLIVPATEAAILALWVGAPPASTRDRS